MGMDKNTTGMLQQGVDLVGDIMSFTSGTGDGSSAYANEAHQRGLLSETEAKGEAQDIQRTAKKDANQLRSLRENVRSKRTTNWGGSNLAMSGSKKLVRDGHRTKDNQAEDDVLFEGQMEADKVMQNSRHKANLLRINSGAAPVRSTLSLGSSIYTRR